MRRRSDEIRDEIIREVRRLVERCDSDEEVDGTTTVTCPECHESYEYDVSITSPDVIVPKRDIDLLEQHLLNMDTEQRIEKGAERAESAEGSHTDEA